MYRPLALFIGLRYIRAKSRAHFLSFITYVSMIGIALGVTVLITVLSVLNGFDREIKKQVFGMISPITISSYDGKLRQWQALSEMLKTMPGVTASSPLVAGQALVSNGNIAKPAFISGILPDQESHVSKLATHLINGSLSQLTAGRYGIVLGVDLAKTLSVNVGDHILVATPQGAINLSRVHATYKNFKVIGIFEAGGGGFGFDSKFAFINLSDAQKFLNFGNRISALRVNIDDIYHAPEIARTIQTQLQHTEIVGNWTDQLQEFFDNIRTTKTLMFFIFILIIAVAVFNLICTMVMVVKNKKADIAILRTLGATPGTILSIFIIQGLTIGIGGTLLGILFGVLLTTNITAIVNVIQTALHIKLVSSNIYFVNYLPSELQWPDVWHISVIAIILCLLATLYPALKAATQNATEALKD